MKRYAEKKRNYATRKALSDGLITALPRISDEYGVVRQFELNRKIVFQQMFISEEIESGNKRRSAKDVT